MAIFSNMGAPGWGRMYRSSALVSRSVGVPSVLAEAVEDNIPTEYRCRICGLHTKDFAEAVFPTHLVLFTFMF